MPVMDHETSPTAAAAPASTGPAQDHGRRRLLRRLGRDYAYVLPGFPLAVLSFCVLVTLTAASVGTFVVWVGALLLPLTLVVASGFAGLSRRRLRAWGLTPAPVRYTPAGRGLTGVFRLMTDPRRWLDLAFESLVAFPLRIATFVVTAAWTGVAVGGLTSWAWRLWLPDDGESGWPYLLGLAFPGVPQDGWGAWAVDSGINLVLGALALLTLPWVMRGLATADARLTAALLGGAGGMTGRAAGEQDGVPAQGREGARLPAFSGTGWTWVGASFAAAVLVAVGWPLLVALYGVQPAVAPVLAVGQSLALVLAVRWVWAAIGLATLAAIGTMLAASGAATDPTTPWPWPVAALVAHCLLVALIGLRHRWRPAVVAWAAGVVATVTAFAVVGEVPAGGLGNGVVLASVSAGLAALGVLIRLWTQNAGRAEQAERLSAEETQRRQDLEERNRIARELHDVVAHSMSVINVQATTAQYRKPGIVPDVQQEFDDIAASSRQALTEMRALLALLRNDDAAPTAAMPRLADIPDLVEATRASGASITYAGDVGGVDAEVPATVGLTAFRAVQEALSNALRHAPGATIEVTTSVEDGSVAVRVVNSAPQRGAERAPGSGLGLAGIRERVTALGGTVVAGPTPQGGFSVVASLPVGGAEEALTR